MALAKLQTLGLILFFCEVSLAANTSVFGDASPTDCRDVHHSDVTDKCAFVKATDSCSNDEGFINYIVVTFCTFSSLIPLGIILFILWWLFLFLGLAVTADDFFCPSLTVMAKVMKMSDNIAGVTLLALGNGAPDIFSAIAAVGSMKSGDDAGLAFGALIGAGVFVTAVVSGAVIISKPFQCMERPLLRDITFYLVAVFYTFCIIYNRQINTIQAIGFLLIYVAYVAVVIIGRYIRKRRQSTSEANEGDLQPNTNIVAKLDTDPDLPTTFSKHLADEMEHEGDDRPHHHHHHHHHDSHTIQDRDYDETDPILGDSSVQIENAYSARAEFLDAINPICREEWRTKMWYGKIYLVVKAPIQFLLTITCPVVDYDSDRNNWNRHLAALQIFLGPIFSIFAINQFGVTLGSKFPLWALVLIISAIVSVTAYWLSANETPPKWHPALAFLGFIVAVVWIYSIANEIVNILQLFGVFFQISNAILGLTLLAWGNSIGDLIADTALARKGYPRIGISACFGGPLFNLLLGVGIPFTIGCIKNGGTFKLQFDFQLVVLTGGLTISLLSTYIVAPFVLKFFMKRWFGIYLLFVYAIFLLLAILTESGVLNIDASNW